MANTGERSFSDTSKLNVVLSLVKTDEERAVAKHIVETHHSYVPSFKSVGRRIDWLIKIDDNVVGMIGIGSSTYPPCADMLKYLGVSKQEYRTIFNSIANNWRFCMSEDIPNIGSKILKCLRTEAKKEWMNKYGNELKYIVTFVGGGHTGAVYKADNWSIIGETAGLPEHKAVSMKWDDNESLSKKFVKPDGKNKKIIFIKKL